MGSTRVSLSHEGEGEIDEIIVTADPDDVETLDTAGRYEIINDPETGKSGIIVYLSKRRNFVLTINYMEPRPDVLPDRVRED